MAGEGITVGNLIVGAMLAFSSGLLFTISRAIIDLLNLNFVDSLLARYIFQFISFITVLACISYRKSTTTDYKSNTEKISWWVYNVAEDKNVYVVRTLLILQGLCGGLSTLGSFAAVTLMPIGDAHALVFTSPIPTMILTK